MNQYMKKLIEELDNRSGRAVSLLLDSNILYKYEFSLELVKSSNPLYIYTAAKNIKGLDLKLLAEAIIKINDLEYIYKFAKDVKDAPLDILENAITKSNVPGYICLFARDVEGTNYNKLGRTLLQIGNYTNIDSFARNVRNGFNIILDIVINSKDAKKIYEFAFHYKINSAELMEAIIKTKDAMYIYMFAKDIVNIDVNKLDEDDECIHLFTKDSIESDTLLLQDAIIKSNSAEYIYKFARDVKNADINKLFDAIIKTNNYEYIFYFSLLVSKEKLNQIVDILVNDTFYLALYNELISNPNFINYQNNREKVLKKNT